jgi:hypothetical protein
LLIFPPAAEHRDRIEHAAVIRRAAAMLVEQPVNALPIEDAEIGDAR